MPTLSLFNGNFLILIGSFIVRVTAIYERYRPLLHTMSLLIVEGIVQQQDGVINLLAGRVMVLPSAGLPGL